MEQQRQLADISLSRDKAIFMVSLLNSLLRLKENPNVDDVYIYFNLDKIEVYVFTFKEDFDTEDYITNIIVQWETEQSYFPEVYINESENKMNILPRKVIKIC